MLVVAVVELLLVLDVPISMVGGVALLDVIVDDIIDLVARTVVELVGHVLI